MREDSHVQVSKQRDGKHGHQIVRWHRAIVLAQHQQPDGQLAISSGRVETYQSAISHTQTLPSSAFPLSLSFSYHPLPLHISRRTQSLCRGLRKPDGIHSVCVCMLPCVCSFPDNRPPELELLALIKTCWSEPDTSQIHSSSHTNTQLLSWLVLWCFNTSLQRRWRASGEESVGKGRHWWVVFKCILHYLYIKHCVFQNTGKHYAVLFQSNYLALEKKKKKKPGRLSRSAELCAEHFSVDIYSCVPKCPLWLDCFLI